MSLKRYHMHILSLLILKRKSIMISLDQRKIDPDLKIVDVILNKTKNLISMMMFSECFLEELLFIREEEVILERKHFLKQLCISVWRRARSRLATTIEKRRFKLFLHSFNCLFGLYNRSSIQKFCKFFNNTVKQSQISSKNISSSNRFLRITRLFRRIKRSRV